jgi:hypothetical protein
MDKDKVEDAEVVKEEAAKTDEQQKEEMPEPVKMGTSAPLWVVSQINAEINRVIGRLEFFERANLSGVGVSRVDMSYDVMYLEDLQQIRDGIGAVFTYKRLDKAEAEDIKKRVEEAKKAAAEKADATPAAPQAPAT